MSHNRLPSDQAMRTERDLGLYVCQCLIPERVWLALWRDYQCRCCGKAILW